MQNEYNVTGCETQMTHTFRLDNLSIAHLSHDFKGYL